MTIVKVESGIHKGQYKIRIQPRDEVTHKRISIPVEYARTKKEASRIENRMWLRIQNGYNFSAANESCSNCFKKYITEEFKQGRWGVKTYQSWQYTAHVISEYLSDIKMKDINQVKIRKFIRKFAKDRKVIINNSSVVAKILNHLRTFFKVYEGTIYTKNPVPLRALESFFRDDEISLSVERYVLKQDEIQSLKDEIKRQMDNYGLKKSSSRLAIWIDIETGMRPQEIQALQWDNIQKESNNVIFEISDSWSDVNKALNGHLKSKKRGEKRKTLPISEDLYLYLKKFKEVQQKYLEVEKIENVNNFIFLNMSDYQKCQLGYPITQTSLNEMLKKLGVKIGINSEGKKWSMYSLRHTVATKLASTSGMNYSWAADRLGHTLNEFMRTYVHVDDDLNSQMMKLWKER